MSTPPTLPSEFTWTPQQRGALDAAAEWLQRNDQQVFRLFGYAGTGKTTLARHLAQSIAGLTLYAPYTGKAASVMRTAGCAGATTLHSLLYLPSPRTELQLKVQELEHALLTAKGEDVAEFRHDLKQARQKMHQPRFSLNPDSQLKHAALLVVDEVSMVNEEMRKHILSFEKKVLVLGDPAQLPPVMGTGAFITGQPDIMLTDIQRQAAQNPIIAWATLARNGAVIPFDQRNPNCVKIGKRQVSAEDLIHRGGQLLTGRNDSRRSLNLQARRLHGASGPYPNKGESLVCLRNDHELGVLNGVTCIAASTAEVYDDVIVMDVEYEGQVLNDVEVSRAPFDAYTDDEAEERESMSDRLRLQRFDFGYCLTVHKAQGSQWPRVTLCDDGFGKRDAMTRRRWLYTAVTRAQHSLAIVA
jgi:exodeoxyribonuclease-5